MYTYYPYRNNVQSYNTMSNDGRLIGGGFLGPFILGGLTGGLVAPFFYGPGPRPNYGPVYGPNYGPRPYPPYYYRPY